MVHYNKTMKQIAIFFILILSFKVHSQKDTVKIERDYWDNGKLKSVILCLDTSNYYSFINWYPNGEKLSEGLYLEHKLIMYSWDLSGNKMVDNGEGQYIDYYENGAKKEEVKIHLGRPTGMSTEYYINGKKKSQGPYKSEESSEHGKKDGLWTFWDYQGRQTEERLYNNDFFKYWNTWDTTGQQIIKMGNGYLKKYYLNNKLEAEGKIKNGLKWGDWKEWFNNGRIKTDLKYEDWPTNYQNDNSYNFVFINSWDSLGNQIGKAGTGWYCIYNEKNQMINKYYILNGSEDSVSISYYQNGKESQVDKFKNGKWYQRTGYHDNGNKAYEYTMTNEREKDGTERTWYYNGRVLLEQLYDKGKLIKKIKYYGNGQKEFEAINCEEFREPIEGKESWFGTYIKCKETYWDRNGNIIK